VLKLRLREWNGATLAGNAVSQVTLATGWQRLSVTYDAAAPGAGSLDFTAYVTNAPPGTCFSADDASVTFWPKDVPPTAKLSAAPSLLTPTMAVIADASKSTDTDTTPIATYSFDFGDGSPGTGPQAEATATHSYAAFGTYTVTVTVVDTAGESATATATVTVQANLIQNSGFETDLTGWNTSGSGAGVVLARAASGHLGGWSAQVSNTGALTTCALNDAPNWIKTTSAGTYVAGLWVRGDAAGAVLRLRLREWSGTTLVGSASAQVTLTTDWKEIFVSYPPAAPGSTLDLNAFVLNAPSGTCFYADDASMVAGS
jgi:PKD repeat protein